MGISEKYSKFFDMPVFEQIELVFLDFRFLGATIFVGIFEVLTV